MTTKEVLEKEARAFARSLSTDRRQRVDSETLFRVESYRAGRPNRWTRQIEWQCPWCWVRDGSEGMRPLRPRPGTDEYDVLACDDPYCGGEFVIPHPS